MGLESHRSRAVERIANRKKISNERYYATSEMIIGAVSEGLAVGLLFTESPLLYSIGLAIFGLLNFKWARNHFKKAKNLEQSH
jgi:hypothetical protein